MESTCLHSVYGRFHVVELSSYSGDKGPTNPKMFTVWPFTVSAGQPLPEHMFVTLCCDYPVLSVSYIRPEALCV